jgi:hypothetical protein
MCAGADCIDDIDVVRSGGMKALFDGVYAPSTIGKLLREFTFGYARQLESVLSAAAMCCYGKQARKFLSWLPEARSRSRGIPVKPDDVGDLGDQLGIGGEFERLGAPGLDSVVAPHPPCRSRLPNPGPTAANSSV